MDVFKVARLYYEVFDESSPRPVWLGVRYDSTVGEYVWGENYEVSTTFWDSGEPNLHTKHICVSFQDGLWDDISCFAKLPFFCVEGDHAEFIPPSPHPNAGVCEGDDTVPFAHHCYMVSLVDTVTWSEASRKCFQKGMDLVSVTSHSEMKFLISLFT